MVIATTNKVATTFPQYTGVPPNTCRSWNFEPVLNYPTGRKYLFELNFAIFANDKFSKIKFDVMLKF